MALRRSFKSIPILLPVVLGFLCLVMLGCPGELLVGDDDDTADDDDASDDDDAADDDDDAADDDDDTGDDDDDATDDDDDTGEDDDDATSTGPELEFCSSHPQPDPFVLESSSLVGSQLAAIVSYGGGRAPHYWTLCWDGLFAESSPVQVSLSLDHDANNDGGLGYVMEQLSFDLTPLQVAWVAGYGPGPGTITVHFEGTTHSFSF
jgi:hypothetical protein